MKKTSLYLDRELDEALARRAADEGLTKAELIRRILLGAVQRPPRPKPQAVGIFRSKDGGIARDLERYLAESGFGED